MTIDFSYDKELPNIDLIDRIKLLRGDILEQKVEAVVTTVSRNLEIRGKLNSDLVNLAGNEIKNHLAINKHKARIGSSVIVPGCNLMAKRIVFYVVPEMEDSAELSINQIYEVYKNAMYEVAEHEIETVAFPGLITGALGNMSHARINSVPIENATKAALHGMMKGLKDNIKEVMIVCFNAEAEMFYSTHLCQAGWNPANNFGSCFSL